ncbi:hypothetical protein PN492_15875 [Dolichospermum circinale CS-537/01]|uniref:Uncharacterized protein n=1 Tax=Dolichospermum circinale CS-537/01 TaxID=3021739 RepID=A0ABT5A986_9CYAN|nr:hypothetical protein [Dolichospermum circinale]MDB9488008.1 hypothetical protein [Dolichospermum circinale CS-537/01]
MSKNTEFNHPQLFRYLSDAEQESLIGGQISPQLDVLEAIPLIKAHNYVKPKHHN